MVETDDADELERQDEDAEPEDDLGEARHGAGPARQQAAAQSHGAEADRGEEHAELDQALEVVGDARGAHAWAFALEVEAVAGAQPAMSSGPLSLNTAAGPVEMIACEFLSVVQAISGGVEKASSPSLGVITT